MAESNAATSGKAKTWAGWGATILPGAVLLMSGGMKLVGGEDVTQMFAHLGWPANLAMAIGVLEIACALLYLVPATSVLGAILVTGYMGGAVATHVRLGEPFFVQVLVGVLAWAGLYLRDARLGALLPFRSSS